MAVSCQEAMVEAQASDRIVAPASGASAATIESLRARLLSERAASKEARQQAHSIAQKVSELQSRLDAETEHRKNAEAAMNEVLEVLKAKGVAMEQIMESTYVPSESSVSEEAAPIKGSKDGESDQSSSEEASAAHMEDKRGGSASSHGSVDDAVLTEGSVLEHLEGSISEDASGSDTAEVEKMGVNRHEEGSRHEQGVFDNPSKAHCDTSLSLTERGEVGGIEQSLESLHDSVVHGEGEISIESSGGQTIANDLCCPPSANQVNTHQEEGLRATSSEQSLGGHQVDDHANEAQYPSKVEMVNGMPMPVTENVPGVRPNHTHSEFFINNGYPYDISHRYANKVHNISPAEAAFPRGLANLTNMAYQSREHSSSRAAELGRYPQAPIRDDILNLVDDKKGKLGSILMALQLAKLQLQDEEQASSYVDEKFETPLPIPINGKHYPGFYESVPYQPTYFPWKAEPHNAAPIIHFPMSPTSDHEVSPFERNDGLRRSSATSAYYMPGYDPYLQQRGELHLGNGITLYTD